MKNKKTVNRFDVVVNEQPSKSIFPGFFTHTTTFNTGEIIPVYWKEILPNDTIHKFDINAIIRQTTFIKPVMDECVVDFVTFFVPWLIIWDDLKKFFGENSDPWAVTESVLIPNIQSPEEGWVSNSLADYLGFIPNKKMTVNHLLFRTYVQIYNDWFRDENLQYNSHLNKGSKDTIGNNGSDIVSDLEKGGMLAIAGKLNDYFTSALPSPQKGPDVLIGLDGLVPVRTENKFTGEKPGSSKSIPLKWAMSGAGSWPSGAQRNLVVSENPDDDSNLTSYMSVGTDKEDFDKTRSLKPANLWGDLSEATGLSLKDVRNALSMLHYFEKDARGGTRLPEFILSHFGIQSPDSRMYRAELLWGDRKPLMVHQVPQTSQGTDTSPQASLSAFGQTNLQTFGDTRTFTEHGHLMTLAVVRYKHTYQEGIPIEALRTDKFSLFDPLLENISEQPIYNKEIFYSGDEKKDNEIFGYKEAFSEYKTDINRVSGKMRSSVPGSMDVYHYADVNTDTPVLSDKFIIEKKENVDRTLAFKSEGEDPVPQFQAEVSISYIIERPMKVFSIPGLKRF